MINNITIKYYRSKPNPRYVFAINKIIMFLLVSIKMGKITHLTDDGGLTIDLRD